MAYKREGLPAYVKEYFFKKLYNPFANFRPFLYMLGLMSVERMTKLGRPNTTAVFGDLAGMDKAERRNLGHSTEHYFSYQKWEPDDGGTVAHRGATPTATTFAEDNMGQAATKWTHFAEPNKMGVSSLDDATGPSQVMSIASNASKITWEALLKRINNSLINGTLTQAQQQDDVRWDDLIGISHVLTTNNFYGQVDRSVETDMNPLNIAAGTDLDSTAVSLDIIDIVNDGNNTIEGRASKSPDGSGCNLHMVHPNLFAALKQEAQGVYQIHQGGIPNHPIGGAKFPCIEYGGNWICYDRGIPTDEMWSLRLASWYLEVDGRYNFQPQPFKKKHENEEGGEMIEWSLVHAKMRLTCREPWLQTKTTGLTAS